MLTWVEYLTKRLSTFDMDILKNDTIWFLFVLKVVIPSTNPKDIFSFKGDQHKDEKEKINK